MSEESLISSEVISEESSAPIEATATDINTNPVAEDSKSFLDSLPEELRAEKSLATFKDPATLAKSFIEAQKMIGKKLENLTVDELKALDKKFGAPENVEDYGIDLGEFKDDNILSGIPNLLLANGIPKDKGKAIVETVLKDIKDIRDKEDTEYKIAVEAKVNELKKELGSTFEGKKNLANATLAKLGGQELVNVISKSELSNDPSFFKFLVSIGEKLKDDAIVGESKLNIGDTKESVKASIKDFREKNKEALLTFQHKDHSRVVEELNKLYILESKAR